MTYLLAISLVWMFGNMVLSIISLLGPVQSKLTDYTIFSVIVWMVFSICALFVHGALYIIGGIGSMLT